MRSKSQPVPLHLLAGSLATAIVVLSLVVPPGTAGGQTPGIHIAGATSTSPIELVRGCNLVVAESANGTPVAALATLVGPSGAVTSIWRFNNSTKLYQVGFFADRSAPVDFASMGSGSTGRGMEGYSVCVSKAAEMVSG